MASTPASLTPPVLKLSVPTLLGTVTAAGDTIKFTLPIETGKWGRNLLIQTIQNAGTTTTSTFEIDVSLDGGLTYTKVPAAAGSQATATASAAAQFDVSGMGGAPVLINFTAITLGGATKISVYAITG